MKSPNRLSVTYAVLERGTEKACHQGDDEGRGWVGLSLMASHCGLNKCQSASRGGRALDHLAHPHVLPPSCS